MEIQEHQLAIELIPQTYIEEYDDPDTKDEKLSKNVSHPPKLISQHHRIIVRRSGSRKSQWIVRVSLDRRGNMSASEARLEADAKANANTDADARPSWRSNFMNRLTPRRKKEDGKNDDADSSRTPRKTNETIDSIHGTPSPVNDRDEFINFIKQLDLSDLPLHDNVITQLTITMDRDDHKVNIMNGKQDQSSGDGGYVVRIKSPQCQNRDFPDKATGETTDAKTKEMETTQLHTRSRQNASPVENTLIDRHPRMRLVIRPDPQQPVFPKYKAKESNVPMLHETDIFFHNDIQPETSRQADTKTTNTTRTATAGNQDRSNPVSKSIVHIKTINADERFIFKGVEPNERLRFTLTADDILPWTTEFRNLNYLQTETYIEKLSYVVVTENPYRTDIKSTGKSEPMGRGDENAGKSNSSPSPHHDHHDYWVIGFLTPFPALGTLQEYLADPQRLETRNVSHWRTWPTQIAYGLVYMHQIDITHSSLSPDKVHIDENGGVTLCDIGALTPVETEYVAPDMQGKSPLQIQQSTREDRMTNDIWALGRMLRALIKIALPYSNPDPASDSNTRPSFKELETWTRIATVAMQNDPKDRIQIAEAAISLMETPR